MVCGFVGGWAILFSECSRTFNILLKFSRTFQNVLERSGMFGKNYLGDARFGVTTSPLLGTRTVVR